MSKEDLKQFSIYMPQSLIEAIDARAEQLGWTRNRMINAMFRYHLEHVPTSEMVQSVMKNTKEKLSYEEFLNVLKATMAELEREPLVVAEPVRHYNRRKTADHD